MTGTGFSIGLGCAAFGLGVSAATARQAVLLLVLLGVVTTLVASVAQAVLLAPTVFVALGCSTIATAALAYLGVRGERLWWIAAANLGLWIGVAIGGEPVSLTALWLGLAFLLILVPAGLLHRRGLRVPTYVAASWVITAGFIHLAFTLSRPAAPVMDHML